MTTQHTGTAGRNGADGAYVAAIDQGTTSSRCIIFDRAPSRVALHPHEPPHRSG
ncbi:hypothetical protein ACFXPZ_30740 [Streptomyces sp. NPDC059101]|uniref:hypothetical protein n=1 Tax=Streptomyces sp. NPDC059101 TaxID=3346728 RepID=UPI0036960E47